LRFNLFAGSCLSKSKKKTAARWNRFGAPLNPEHQILRPALE
jgi:hypothetical protein